MTANSGSGFDMELLDFQRIVFDNPKPMKYWYSVIEIAVSHDIRKEIQPQFRSGTLIGIFCKTPETAMLLKLLLPSA